MAVAADRSLLWWGRVSTDEPSPNALYTHHRHWCHAVGLSVVAAGAGRWRWVQSVDAQYERRREALEAIVVAAADEIGDNLSAARRAGWDGTSLAELLRLAACAGRWWPHTPPGMRSVGPVPVLRHRSFA